MGTPEIPLSPTVTHEAELRLLRLARELAMDLAPVAKILERVGISAEEWEQLQRWPRFQAMLAGEAAQWEGALNTHERVRLKAAVMIEEWLPEAYARMTDRGEALPAKVETAKLVTRLAGMGLGGEGEGGRGSGGAEKFSLVINIGDGVTRRVSSETKVIEG